MTAGHAVSPQGDAAGQLIGIVRIALWQMFGFYDYGPHWVLIALTVASAPFVATLVDVTGS
jgi:magnesium transporter